MEIEEKYDLLITGLSRMEEAKLNLTDDELSYHIFEELDIETVSFMHGNTLNPLVEGGLISKEIKDEVFVIRNKIMSLMKTKHSIAEYRNDNEWKTVRKEANSLLMLIKQK